MELKEGEYEVEKVLNHQLDPQGNPEFQVKWEGFPMEENQKWEPAKHLLNPALWEYFRHHKLQFTVTPQGSTPVEDGEWELV